MRNMAVTENLTASLRVRHLVAQPLRKPSSTTATSTTADAAALLPAPPAFGGLLPLVALRAILPVVPAGDVAELLVEGLLVLLDQGVDLVRQHLRQLLRARHLDAVEDDDACLLVERRRELLAPDHLGDDRRDGTQRKRECAREQRQRQRAVVWRVGEQVGAETLLLDAPRLSCETCGARKTEKYALCEHLLD